MPARPGERRLLRDTIVGLLLVSVVCTFFWFILTHLNKDLNWGRIWNYRKLLIDGWLLTLGVSAGALLGSCLVAAVLVAGSRSRLTVLRWLTRGFVEIVRGMPLLSLILIGYFVIFAQQDIVLFLERIIEHCNESNKFWLHIFAWLMELLKFAWSNRIVSGIVLLSVFTAAYLSEILRGGLDSIPQGQIDSARAVGFDRPQILRYVIMPQALRRVLPALAGQFVTLVKDSSLLNLIGIQELTYQSRAYNSATYGGIEAFLLLAVGYLLITLPIAWFAHWMEKRFRYQM